MRGPNRSALPLRATRSAALSIAGLVALGGVVACDDDGSMAADQPKSTRSSTSASPPRSPAPSAADQVLKQYRAFWASLVPTADAAKERRRALLAPYATDPALSRILRGMLAQELSGRGVYGEVILYPEPPRVSGRTAEIADCQNASMSGQKDRRTGERLTRGVKNNPVTVTMTRGGDGIWRVATVDYPGGTCQP